MSAALGIGSCTLGAPKTQTRLRTKDKEYAARLLGEEAIWWKRIVDVQILYRWNLRRMNLGFTLDIGCGIGRNLANLMGNGIGVDHNPHAVEIARLRGLQAYTPDEFECSSFNVPDGFDSILLSHVAEHMADHEVIKLLADHINLLKAQGQIVLITPQEYGHKADPTHVQFMDFQRLRNISRESGLVFVKEFSFPFPRAFGRIFRYNEFVSISRKP